MIVRDDILYQVFTNPTGYKMLILSPILYIYCIEGFTTRGEKEMTLGISMALLDSLLMENKTLVGGRLFIAVVNLQIDVKP